MRLDRYIFREIATPTVIALAALAFVLFSHEMGRFLEIIVVQSASASEIWDLAVAVFPNALTVTIPIAALIGILTGFGRMSSDSETVALRAVGVPMRRILVPVLAMAGLAAIASLSLTVWVAPQSGERLRRLARELELKQVALQVTPRVFDERLKNYKLYVQTTLGPGRWEGILLVNVEQPNNPRLWLARSGEFARDDAVGKYQLTLTDGMTLFGEPRSAVQKLDVDYFDRRTLKIDIEQPQPRPPLIGEVPTEELWRRMHSSTLSAEEQRAVEAEFHRRLAIPFGSLAFALIGLPLAVSTQRGSRSFGLVISLILVLAYYLAMIGGAGSPRLSPVVAAWVPNVAFSVLGAILLVRSDRGHENRALLVVRDWTDRVVAIFAVFRRRGGVVNSLGNVFARRSKVFRLLDAYVLRGFCFYFVLVLATFISLYVVVTLFNLLPDIINNRAPIAVVVKYFFWLLPYVVYMVAPLSVLLGILIELGTLTKTNEIMAVKAGAVSLYRLSLPLMAMGLALSGAIYAMQDYVLPYSNQRQNEYRDIIKGRAPQTYRDPQSKWMMGSNDRMYHYDYFEPDQNEFAAVTIFQFEPGTFKLRDWVFARSGAWNSSGWLLKEGWVRRFAEDRGAPSYRPFSTLNYSAMDTPDYFKTELRSAQEMTYSELKRHVEDMTQSGFDVRRISVDLYRKVSFPLASFIMALIGIPFSFSTGKKGAFHGIGLSIVLGILYWATFELFNKLGGVNSLSPVVAAWFPNLIFGSGGIWLMLRLET